MGQQYYEHAIQRAVAEAAPLAWQFRSLTVTSARSQLAATRRLPFGAIEHAPVGLAALVGQMAWGRKACLVHRFDLRLPPCRSPEVVTVHDLPPLRFSDEGSMPRAARDGAQRARLVICPSTFAAQEVQALLGVDRVRIIPYGLSEVFLSGGAVSSAELGELGVHPPYVVHAAGATARKNLGGLAAAWRDVRAAAPEAMLVMCGPPDPRRTDLFRGIAGVRLAGKLAPAQVARLMRGAAAVVVPSVYEGFGLPALEGMACGTVVVAAAAGALPEVCGDAAIMVEPTAADLAGGLLRALQGGGDVDRLVERGPPRASSFTWSKAARAHLRAYEEALA